MNSSVTASASDAVAAGRKVTSMKAPQLLAAAIAATLALVSVSTPAEARDRGRGSVTFHFGYYGPGYWWGPGYWGPGYWGPGYRYLPPPPVVLYPDYPGYWPPVVVARPDPPVYIERDGAPPETPAAAEPPAWWYWCPAAKAYYPYVKECPGGWQRVPPQPVTPSQ